jgi:hypothetical protein
MGTARHSTGIWRSIGRSWLALKTWVKVWLLVLNLVFLFALQLPRSPLRAWVVYSYLAAGICLLPIMVRQRGLTRLLGVGHLVPWLPLLAYLVLRVSSALAGPQLTLANAPLEFAYVVVLLDALVVCLTFDVYDVYRYARGERFVMGSREAAAAGASRLTTEAGIG